MRSYKRIERLIAGYIAGRYRSAAEIGVGENFEAALSLDHAGVRVVCTDIKGTHAPRGIRLIMDDVFSPKSAIFKDFELIYAIRPGLEMIAPMVSLAREVDADLLVYHLGNECCGRGGEVIDCGVILHRYHRRTSRQPDTA